MSGECAETRKLCSLFKQCNAMVLNVTGSMFQEPGWPDRYVAHRDWAGWIEFKWEDGKLKDKQRVVLGGLRARGVGAFVVRFREGGLMDFETNEGRVTSGYPIPKTPQEAQILLSRMASW